MAVQRMLETTPIPLPIDQGKIIKRKEALEIEFEIELTACSN